MEESELDEIQTNKPQIIVDSGFASNLQDTLGKLREFALGLSSSKVTEVSENPDLVDYKTLSIKKEYLGNISLKDSFFDSFREDYKGFDDWFNKKSNIRFKVLNITSFWKTTLFGKSFQLYGDYARNTDSEDNDYAYAFGFSIGKMKKRGYWAVGYKYARIEPDAVVGIFADANFGGANRYGNKFSLKYKFHPKMVFAATTWITESVRGPEDDMTDVALDLIFKF